MLRLIAFLALLPSAALAQAEPATSLPAPLVTALLSRGTPTYYVNALPAGWPASLAAPRDARVVGGMRSGREIVAIFDDTMPRALAAFDSAFEAAGYTHPPEQPRRGFQGMQFRSGYCRDSSFIHAMSVPGVNGHAYVQVRYLGGSTACTVTPQAARQAGILEIPLLQPPPGATTPGGGYGGGTDEQNAYATLNAPSLSAAQVLEHYAKQLASAGWTPAVAATSGHGALQQFDARDAQGGEWSGALVVVSHGNVRDVSLLMRRMKP